MPLETNARLRTDVAAALLRGEVFLYCHVRMKGAALGRAPSVKIFYTQNTKVFDFVQCCARLGVVKKIDFPEPQNHVSPEELGQAVREGRIVL